MRNKAGHIRTRSCMVRGSVAHGHARFFHSLSQMFKNQHISHKARGRAPTPATHLTERRARSADRSQSCTFSLHVLKHQVTDTSRIRQRGWRRSTCTLSLQSLVHCVQVGRPRAIDLSRLSGPARYTRRRCRCVCLDFCCSGSVHRRWRDHLHERIFRARRRRERVGRGRGQCSIGDC